MRKTTRKKIAPIVITVLVVLYLGLPAMFLLTLTDLWDTEVKEAGASSLLGILLPLLWVLLLLGAGMVGIVKALLQRLREIDGGEEEEASQY